MQKIILIILLSLSISPLFSQEGVYPVDVYLLQGKDSIYLNNQVIKVKKVPFTLVFVFNNPKLHNGVFVNTSFTKDYYNMYDSKKIKDLNYLPQKVYSEHKYNPNKELKVNEEFFQYFGYNPKSHWNKFDRLIKKDGKIIAYRKVHNFNLVNKKEIIPNEKMKFSVFFLFEVIKKRTSFSNEEVYRAKARIKFRS